jgi:hypothetical protein
MNVAMTSARKQLVVIGDSATIGMIGFISDSYRIVRLQVAMKRRGNICDNSCFPA